jgi:4-amino-4-deoxychorismate lyase
VSLKDRGLAYGDGLFETIAVRRGSQCCWTAICSVWRGVPAVGDQPDPMRCAELLAYARELDEGVSS